MKKCKTCGKLDSDSVLFCAGCGGREFVPESAQDGRFDFTPTEIKGRVKAWQIIVIAIACFAIIAAGVLAVMNILNTKSYTNGEISDNVYLNDWAEIRFDFADSFTDITSTNGATFDDEYSDVGFVAERAEGNVVLSLSFQHLGDTRGYSEKEGMDDFLEGYGDELTSEFGGTPSFSDYFDYTVAEKEYTTAKVNLPGMFTEYHCIRFEGEYAIIISIAADSEADIISALSAFEYYEGE